MAKVKRDPTRRANPPERARLRKKSASVAARQKTRREDLLDAADAIVTRGGLAALTATSLAAALGVVPGALYRTVSSLDEVKAALVIRATRRLESDLERALARHPPERTKRRAVVRLVALARVLPALQDDEPARFRLIDTALGSLEPLFDEALRAEVELSTMRALAVVERAVVDAARVGALDEERVSRATPGTVTLALLALVHGATHLKKRDRFDVTARSSRVVLDVALRALLIGLGASPALVDDALEEARG